MSAEFAALLGDPCGFATAAVALNPAERVLLPELVRQDRHATPGSIQRCLASWLALEDEPAVVAALLRALRAQSRHGRTFRTQDDGEEILWLVREPHGEALEVREDIVRYHATGREFPGHEAPVAEVIDAAAVRLWSQRGELPADATRFAAFFDGTSGA